MLFLEKSTAKQNKSTHSHLISSKRKYLDLINWKVNFRIALDTNSTLQTTFQNFELINIE